MKIEIEKLRRHKAVFLLFGIFLIGFAVRYITKHELLFDPDSYFWYQLAMYFAGIKTQHFIHVGGKTIFELQYYPTGSIINNMMLGLPIAIGYTFKLFSFAFPKTPEGMMSYMFIFGPFFGALTCVIAYFLAYELTENKKASFLVALFYSFAPFAMTRNTAGDTGQESLSTFFLFMFLYLFLKASKQDNVRKSVLFAALSGISFWIGTNTWGGSGFYLGLLASSVLVYFFVNILTNEYHYPLFYSIISFSVVGLLFPTILKIGFLDTIRNPALAGLCYFASFFAILIIILDLFVKDRVKFDIRIIFLAIVGFIIVAIYLSGFSYLFYKILDFITRIVLHPEEKSITGKTVAYYRTSSFEDFKRTFNILLIFIPAGFSLLSYKFYREKKFTDIFMILFMILGILAFRMMIRLSFFLAFILPLFVAISFEKVFEIIKKGKNIKTNSIFVTVFLILIVSMVCSQGINQNKAQKYADLSVMPWKDAGEWIKENTPEKTLLIHWWDYGYHLQTFAERYTIVDGGNSGPPVPGGSKNRNIDVAKAFCSNEDEFYKYIKPYNKDNLPIYVLVSYEEFGKSGAINFHAQDELFIQSFSIPKTGSIDEDTKKISEILKEYNITTYSIVPFRNKYLIWFLVQRDAWGNYHPEWSEKVLAKLLPFNTGLARGMKHFKLVYHNGYVYIYKFTP